jgi:hypothetical protein
MTQDKVDSKAVHVCVMPFSAETPNGPETFTEGFRLEGSNEMVKRFPDYWAREDLPSEIAAKRKAAWAGALSASYTDHNPPRVLRARLRVKRAVKVDVDGEPRRIRKGDLLENNDPVAQFVPDAFELVQI